MRSQERESRNLRFSWIPDQVGNDKLFLFFHLHTAYESVENKLARLNQVHKR